MPSLGRRIPVSSSEPPLIASSPLSLPLSRAFGILLCTSGTLVWWPSHDPGDVPCKRARTSAPECFVSWGVQFELPVKCVGEPKPAGKTVIYVEAKRRRTPVYATDHSVAAACATRYTYAKGGSFYGIHSARHGRTGAHRQVGIHQGRALGQRRSLC